MPLISVVIPMFNAAATVKDTVESVLNQTWIDFELIIVNDGSTDDSVAIVQQFSDPRIQIISQANAGAPASRNRGLAAATGEFVAFLDADDLWTTDKLEAQLKALQANPDAALAYSWNQFIDASGRLICLGRRVDVSDNAYQTLLVTNFIENGSNPLIRRQALIDVGGFDQSLRSSQDRDLYLRLAKRFRFVRVPSYQVLYRMTPGSITSDLTRQEQQALAFIDRAFAEAPNSLQHLKSKSLAHLYRYLTLRGLEDAPSWQQTLTIARCLGLMLRHDPSLLRRQTRFVGVLAAKTVMRLVMPGVIIQRRLTSPSQQALSSSSTGETLL